MNEYSLLRERIAQLSPTARALLEARLADTQPSSAPDDIRLVAYVVPVPGSMVNTSQLRELLSTRLPAYMLPASIVSIAALPMTPNGKLDRRALPDPFVTLPEQGTYVLGPRNTLEKEIMSIWSALLGSDQIDMNDDFFELGGHSLLLARLLVQLRERYAIDVPLATFFQRPSIAGLAEYLATMQWVTMQPEAVPEQERDEVEL